MKFYRGFSLGIAAMSLLACASVPSRAQSADNWQILATKVSTAPVIDGKLNDQAWAGAKELGGFTALRDAKKPATTPTFVKVLTDGKSLIFGIRCIEPRMSETKSPTVPRDGAVWAQDSIEIVIDPAGTRNGCYEFAGGLSGGQCDAKMIVLPSGVATQDVGWNADWDFKAHKGAGEWTAEMRIPYSSLGIDPSKNSMVGINFNRSRWVGTNELSNWKPNFLNFSEPWSLAELIIPDEDGSFSSIEMPALNTVVAGSDIKLSVVNSTKADISPKLVFEVESPSSQKGEITLGKISAGSKADIKLPIDITKTGSYSVQLKVVDSATGKPICSTSRVMDVTQPFVFDEAIYALYLGRVDAVMEARVPTDKGSVRLSLMKDGVEKPIKKKFIKSPLGEPLKVSFGLSGETDGVYRLRAELIRAGKTICAGESQPFNYKTKPMIYMNKEEQFVVDGKPFFPIGIYCVTGKDAEDNLKVAKEAKAAGFNCTVLYQQTWDTAKPILDALNDAGMKALIYPTQELIQWERPINLDKVRQDVNERRNHPALLGWYVTDEPEAKGIGVDKPIRQVYRCIKEMDQDHPCMLVITRPTAAHDQNSSCDSMWIDPYPIGYDDLTVSYVSDMVKGAIGSIQKDKPLWCVAQAFDWSVWQTGKVNGIHRPTDDEERCMTYLALASGAKGVIYWTYTSSAYHITDYPEHWAYMKKLAGEVSSISPVLMSKSLDGKLISTPSRNSITTMVKKVDGSWYVFAINTSSEYCTSGFKLASGDFGRADVLFENRSLDSKDGSWNDGFKPLEVHIYKIFGR